MLMISGRDDDITSHVSNLSYCPSYLKTEETAEEDKSDNAFFNRVRNQEAQKLGFSRS